MFGAGNHELRNLVAGYVLQSPSLSFSSKQLATEINQKQSVVPELRLFPSTVTAYCQSGLVRAEAVVNEADTAKGQGAHTTWKAHPEAGTIKCALAGLIGDISLRWPDVSVQQVFGRTHSHGAVQLPELRYRICKHILSASEPLSVFKINTLLDGGGYKDKGGVDSQIDALVDNGILHKESNKNSDRNPLIKIKYTDFRSYGELSAMTPETQALYGALGRLGTRQTISTYDLINEASQVDPSIDPAKLRTLLFKSLKNNSPYPGLTLAEKEAAITYSRITFTGAAEQPVAALFRGIASFDDPDIVKGYIQRNADILASREDCGALAAKAQRFSGHESTTVVAKKIEDLLVQYGGADAKTVRSALGEQGIHVGKPYVGSLLNKMAAAGTATVEELSVSGYTSRRNKIYRLAAREAD